MSGDSALPDRFRLWFRYETDAHGLTLESLETVPLDRRDDGRYQRALDLFGHLLAASRLWLCRMGHAPAPPPALFPSGTSLEALRREAAEVHAAWQAVLDRLTPAELARRFEYASLEGPAFSSTVEEILTQLAGHSWYHRGQIAALVREAGGIPAETDFVFWSRRPVRG